MYYENITQLCPYSCCCRIYVPQSAYEMCIYSNMVYSGYDYPTALNNCNQVYAYSPTINLSSQAALKAMQAQAAKLAAQNYMQSGKWIGW